MATIDHNIFLNIFGLYIQKRPLQSCYVDIEDENNIGRVLRKGFVLELENGSQLIFSPFERWFVYGIRTPDHDLLPMPLQQVLNMNHLYSLLVQYGKKEVLCN